MPTYQYACTACGHRLEAVQSFSDAPLTVCPECDGGLRKVYSSVGIVFKGSGFYRTDSRDGAKSPSQEASKEPTAASSDASTSSNSGSGGSDSGSGSTGSGSSGAGKSTPAPAAAAASTS